jgi:GAF domain-containing protein
MNDISEFVQINRADLENALAEAFLAHVNLNQGELASPEQSDEVVSLVASLLFTFLNGTCRDNDVNEVATQFAKQGMSFESATKLMHAISPFALREENTAVSTTINSFQFNFLQQLTKARESIQEEKQQALKRTVDQQLEAKRISHKMQTQRTHDLNQILQLNARLAAADNEQNLLHEAVVGLCQALKLMDVSVYQYNQSLHNWLLRATSVEQNRDLFASAEFTNTVQSALELSEDIVQYLAKENGEGYLSVSTVLQAGANVLGAMVVRADQLDRHNEDALLIMIRTFAQNLAAQWSNLSLLQETNRRSKELQVLYGRFVDELWREESMGLQATYHQGQLDLSQQKGVPQSNKATFPLQIGDFTFGQIQLPEDADLSTKDKEFVQSITREMGDALNNTYLLQTTRSFSTQLEVAAEVSRAASTILDQTKLIESVVNLIQERFGFYYVGLFLVDNLNKMAVLKSGTGKAGQVQLARKHALPLDDSSMIGAAITSESAFVEQDVTNAVAFMKNPVLPNTQSELALPLRTHDQTIGALTVQSEVRGAFSKTAVTVLQSLADQLAIAIENASLFARTQQNLSEANRLYEAGRHISTAQTANEIYQILVDFAAESGLFDIAQAYIEDPNDSDYLLRVASWNRVGIENDINERLQRDIYSASVLLERTHALWFDDDFSSLDDASKSLFESYHVNGGIFIPLYAENEWLGALILACSHTPTPSKQDVQPYRTLARQAAAILANHQLLLQTEVLYKIGRAITQTITRDDALQIAVREVGNYIGASQCRFILYDQKEGVGHIVATTNPSGIANNIKLPMLGDEVYTYLGNEDGPLLLEENGSNVSRESIQQHVLQFGAKASLLIPSASQQELIGFLAIDSVRGKRPFKPSNIIFAQTVIDHITTQIENIKLLDEALEAAHKNSSH